MNEKIYIGIGMFMLSMAFGSMILGGDHTCIKGICLEGLCFYGGMFIMGIGVMFSIPDE